MEMNVGRGLWGKGCREGTVGKGVQGGDCVERDAGRGLCGKGCREGTVGKGMRGLGIGMREGAAWK